MWFFLFIFVKNYKQMKKILFLLLLAVAGYGQTSTGQEQEFDYGIKNNSTQTITTPTYLTTTGTDGTQGKIPSAYIEKTADKISTITGYSETSYPNEKAAHDALDLKLNISDLPTNLTLYPTNVASDVGGYVKMVTDIHDADYNTVAVDVSTPTITGTAQLVSQRISAPGVLIGQPGVFNITTFGNIKRLSGTGTANFYFEVYHRNLAGTETLICTSSVSDVVSLSTYSEFTASGIWNDGDFIATDRIVIKTYANRIAGGTDPVYQFQFGGTQPVRTLLPVPFSVVDAGYEMSSNKQNSLAVDGTGTKYPTVDAVNAALPVTYSTVVYVNSTSPNTATIFDDVNPPVSNDPLLDNDTANLYIGADASTWVYNGSTYVTKVVPATSNFYIENTSVDAGNNKEVVLQRFGGISSESAITSKKDMSDTVNLGSTFRLFNSGSNTGNIFQLNASNGVDIWNLADGNWNKRFTFFGNGNLRQHSTVSNTEHIMSAPNNTPVLSFLGADNSRPIFGYKGLAFRIGSVTGEGAAGLTEQLQLFANGNLILQNGGDHIDNGNRLQVTGSISATNYTGSATLTDTPTAPTAAPGTNTTQIATTAFVQTAKNAIGLQEVIDVDEYAWKDSENSYVSFMGGTTNDRTSIIETSNGSGSVSSLFLNNGFGYLRGYTTSNYSSLDFSNGIASLVRYTTDPFTKTSISVDPPTVETTINFPAPTVAGNYKVALQEIVKPYKVYVALLSQTGTNAPVATVLENTLGGTVTYSYTAVGSYNVNLTGAFTSNKTVFVFNNNYEKFTSYTNSGTLSIITKNGGSNANDLMSNLYTSIEIRVYP